MRRILHVDMDAFYASIEQNRHPELRGKPLVIGNSRDPAKMDTVSTASYEARRCGIYLTMPLKTAREVCPQAIFLPADHGEYLKISEKIKNLLRTYCSRIEDAGIDEAFLDISHTNASAEEIAQEIKKIIVGETGLTCSIGVAPNKLLAKMASDMQKPDGITILTGDDVKSRIWPLPVRKLVGVGPSTERTLTAMGVRTIGDLAGLPPDELTKRFGRSRGKYLYEASRGIDESPVTTSPEKKSSGRETTGLEDKGKQ
ncbi:MAG: DNA polymerase IV [wastewater metagenome]|nr:DNA polymerase IV [Candidatus Loosdrechtia aerotolerans]